MSVSILIPAFRPTYLRQAIASALTQATDDFELIVSDDSGDQEIRPIVEQFRDPRIRYVRTPGRVGAGENCRRLWGEARHDLLLFLLDDDVLLPHALSELLAQAAEHPDASFYFGQRYTIDGAGRILSAPPPFAHPVIKVSGEDIAATLVGNVSNVIGELNNVLINRRIGLKADDLLSYMGTEIHLNSDVSFFLNATRKGSAIGISKPIASFRKHPEQNSSPAFNPIFAIAVCEWELFIRGELSAGRLTSIDALKALDILEQNYAGMIQSLPTIARMVPGLAALRSRITAGEQSVLDDAFWNDWSAFVAEVKYSKADRINPPQPQY